MLKRHKFSEILIDGGAIRWFRRNLNRSAYGV